MHSTLTKIQEDYLNGAYETEEEYHAAMDAATAYYYEQLGTYSSLYTSAVTADSRIIQDAWSSQFSNMVTDSGTWKTSISGYISGAKSAFEEWDSVVATVKNTAGENLSILSTNVSKITTASNELVTAVT
jgi:hypothetical protein